MSHHLLFLVHGMGKHPPGWSESVHQVLRQRYQSLERSQLWPWEPSFKVVEVHYDDIFEELRERWKLGATGLEAQLVQAGLQKSALTRIQGMLETFGSDHFISTHVLDVVMYRFFANVREAVKARVGQQITEALSRLPTDGKWSVIAHSLGTSVAHDTLHALASANGAPRPAIRPAYCLMTLANVSRTLQTDVKAYDSLVRPVMPGQPGVLQYFLDVHHKWDPIPAFWPYQPHDEWPDPETRMAGRFREVALNVISEPNVHGFEHYLRDPACYVPLFRRLTLPELISQEEASTLTVEYLRTNRQLDFDNLRRRLEKTFVKRTGSHADLVRMLIHYYEVVGHG